MTRQLKAAAMLLSTVAALAGGTAPFAHHPARAAVATALPLPIDRLHFGLANDPSQISWMTASGVPWRYRYQYLSGGVNTGAGWETWNTPSGQFATYYMDASGAAGYIPVFSYYELLQSKPSVGSNENDRDYGNANNAATMNAYFANFKLLMQKIAAYGKTVVVHVEPDFWGYMEQRAAGQTADKVSAKVNGSGFADVAGIPDTVQGFGEALLKLRDLYAPNAVLAIHASMWGSGIDVASDTRSSVSGAAEADVTAAFLNSAGIASNPFGSTWDLVFDDVDDHDAGWWEAQGADNQYFTHWWDPANVRFPNFARYLAWVGELHAKTGRPQVVWQVPVGNQYFLTMNNTCGHYQDNVGSYFINHAADLYSAGLIAVLFGAGNGCQTSYTDVMGDGVTNNGGATTTDIAGFCTACNTHVSRYSDDDGGFLRVFVGLYYANAMAIGGVATSDPDVASWGAGRVDVFARGADGAIWHRAWTGSSWQAWESLGGRLTSAPSAVSGAANRIDVFARGADNALWHRQWNGAAWLPWESLGGSLSSAPDAASWGPSRLDVFARGADGGLWQRTWNGTSWLAWQPVGGRLLDDPSAVASTTNSLDVFVRGLDGAVWHRAWNGSSWLAWQSLGGSIQSSPDAASCSAGTSEVFALGSDGGLWRRSFDGTAWSAWSPVGGKWIGGPGAACEPGTTTVDVAARAPDSSLWRLVLSA